MDGYMKKISYLKHQFDDDLVRRLIYSMSGGEPEQGENSIYIRKSDEVVLYVMTERLAEVDRKTSAGDT
jgi:hypothetical protein